MTSDPLWLPVTDESDFVGPVMVSGDGNHLVDAENNRYLSASSGLWNVALGYSQDTIRDAIVEQVRRLPYGTLFRYRNEPAMRLARELVRITPSGLSEVFYSCSGAGAVDTAVKVARKYWVLKGEPERRLVVAFEDAYHGLSSGALAVSSDDLEQEDYGVDDRLVRRVPFPSDDDLPAATAALCGLLEHEGPRVAAVLFEPVQGTRCLPMAAAFGPVVAELRDRYGFLLIADEVTTGFGRTGTLFACEWLSLEPDAMCLSKAIDNGYLPLAATMLTRDIRRTFLEADAMLWNGETQAGNPVACAAALATIGVLQQHGLPESARGRAEQLGDGLRGLAGRGLVTSVRGAGFMWGVQLRVGAAVLESPDLWRLVRQALHAGVLLHPIKSGIGVMPPLTVTEAEIEQIVQVVHDITVKL